MSGLGCWEEGQGNLRSEGGGRWEITFSIMAPSSDEQTEKNDQKKDDK
jgi:hypothetical protein